MINQLLGTGLKFLVFLIPVLYLVNPDGVLVTDDPGDKNSNYFRDFDKRTRLQFLSAGEGLVSSPSDYIRFAQMLANKGELNGRRILKTATVEMMTTPNYIKNRERQNLLQGSARKDSSKISSLPAPTDGSRSVTTNEPSVRIGLLSPESRYVNSAMINGRPSRSREAGP